MRLRGLEDEESAIDGRRKELFLVIFGVENEGRCGVNDLGGINKPC
jgi:hypothetical protein